MSSNENDTKFPTNKEIIEDLTKDLENQCITSEPESVDPTGSNKSDNEAEEEKTSRELEDDYVDEELLKKEEANLSEEEKFKRKGEANELKTKGNEAFKSGNHIESLNFYTEALKLCPLLFESERAVFYSNRAASKAKLNRKPSAIDDCTKAIELNPNYVRAYLRRANLYEETEKLNESLEDFKKVLEMDPGVPEARTAIVRLPPLIEEQNEKMKTEMFGKNYYYFK